MPAPYIFAGSGTEPAYDVIDVTPDGGDVDLSDPEGPTAGVCARGIYCVGTGNVIFYCVGAPVGNGGAPAPEARTLAVTDAATIGAFVTKIVDSGTTVTSVFALL